MLGLQKICLLGLSMKCVSRPALLRTSKDQTTECPMIKEVSVLQRAGLREILHTTLVAHACIIWHSQER